MKKILNLKLLVAAMVLGGTSALVANSVGSWPTPAFAATGGDVNLSASPTLHPNIGPSAWVVNNGKISFCSFAGTVACTSADLP